MGKNVVKAKLDVIFKKVFSENSDLLQDFLASILDIPVDDILEIEPINSEALPESLNDKFSRMDLCIKLKDMLINVEIQVKNQSDFRDRAMFYWSKLYTSELKSGEPYGNLKRTISVNVINFNMFECEDFHSEFGMYEKNRHERLTEKCAVHFFELKKINKTIDKNNRKQLWMQFINAESEEELDMLRQTDIPVMKKAVMVIHEMSADEKTRELARLREKALHDEASELATARKEGVEEGIEKGRKEGIEKGRKEGIEKGRKEGIEEGIQQAKNKLISKLRVKGMSEEEIKEFLDD